MASYSDYVGYVPDRLRIQVSGTTTGDGLVPAIIGLPNEYYAGTAQGIITTSGGVSSPGVSLLGAQNTLNIESGVSGIVFQNIVSVNGTLRVTGEANGVNISTCSFPKLEYCAGVVTAVDPRLENFQAVNLKGVEGQVIISGSDLNLNLNTTNLRRSQSYEIIYGAGTLSGIDKAFSSYSRNFYSGTITGLSYSALFGIYAFSGYIGGTLVPLKSYSIDIRSSNLTNLVQPVGSIAFTGDFLPNVVNGSIFFANTSNFTEINIAKNYSGTVSGHNSIYYVAHSHTTGITFPPVNGDVSLGVALATNTTTGTLSINASGSGRLGQFVFRTKNTSANTKPVTITIEGYTSMGSVLVLGTSGVLDITHRSTGVSTLTANSITGITGGANSPFIPIYISNINGTFTFNSTTPILTLAATVGTTSFELTNTAASGSVTVNFPNLTGMFATSGTTLTANASRATVNFDAAALRSLSGSVTLEAYSSGAKFDFNTPLLSGVGRILATCSGRNTTGLITLAHPGTANNRGITAITGTANGSGSLINIQCTGGTPHPSGIIGSIDLTTLSGANIIADLGAAKTFNTADANFVGINLDAVSGGANSSITLNATGVTGYRAIAFTGGPGTVVNYTGGEIASGSRLFVRATGVDAQVNFTFTGGTLVANSHVVSGIAITAIDRGTVTGDLGALTQTTGFTVTGLSSGIASITSTGLNTITGTAAAHSSTGAVVSWTGGVQKASLVSLTAIGAVGSSATVSCVFTGVAATGLIDNIAITGLNAQTEITGTINNTSTISTGVRIISSGRALLTATGITIISGVYPNSLVITGFTTSSVVSGIFPGLQTISDDLSVTVSGSGGVSFSGLQVVSGAYIVSGGTSAGRVDHGLSGVNSLTGIAVIQSKTQTIYLGGSNNVTGAISATGLTQIGNSGTIFNLVSGVVTSSGITNMDLRSLTGWYGRINVELAGATGLNLTSLQYIGSNSATGFAASQMNTPALQFILGTGITGDVTLTGLQYMYHRDQHNAVAQGTATGFLLIASGATSISMPNIVTGFLRQISGNTTKTGWIQGANVTGLSFGSSGTTKQLFMNFTASGCPLNQASVDNILQTFASLDGTNSTTVYSGLTIRLNGLCAAPSATGSGYRTTLTGAGRLNTVLVN